MRWVRVLGASLPGKCVPASTQESEDEDEQEQGAFPSSIAGDFQQALGESIPVRTLHCFRTFLSPNSDNMRLFEDVAVIHAQKYSLKLLQLDSGFTLLAWLAPGVCSYAYL